MTDNRKNSEGGRISLTFRQVLTLIAIGALLILVGTGVITVEKLLGIIK